MIPVPLSAARQAAGLALAGAILLLVACLGGGWIALGRVDPLLAVPGAGWAAMAGALASRSSPGLRLSGAYGLGILLLLALVQWHWGGWVDWLPSLLAALAIAAPLMPAWTMAAFVKARGGLGRYLLVGAMAAGAWVWQLVASPLVALAYDPWSTDEQPRVVVVTSLPLFAASRGDLGAVLSGDIDDAEAIIALRQHFDLLPMANPDAQGLAEGSALFLAHPGPLAPEALVAIDAWVRGGGRAVVLADALLEAEPPFPLGDSRNPPVTTMLDPLLAHWGVVIGPAREGAGIVSDANQRLIVSSAGLVSTRSSACRQVVGGVIARCRIGRGQVVIIGDADMLDPANWSGWTRPMRPVGWHSANISWLAAQLDPKSASRARTLAQPVWAR